MKPQIITVHDICQSIDTLGIEPFANTLVQEMSGGYFYVETETVKPDEIIIFGPVKYRIHPVPMRLAWFVIDALALKSAALNMGNHAYPEGCRHVYLPEGAEIFGMKINQLTEIPAEMGPVVMDKL